MGVPSCYLLERAHKVKAPYYERPSDGDHLQSVSGEVGLLGIQLAPMARTNKLDGISYGRWPVEALSKGVANEGSGSRMVATSPRVWILEELPTFLYGDTALQDAGQASPLQFLAFTVDHL